MRTETTYPAPVVAQAVGITYRQLDHWISRGYVPVPTQGTGYPRGLTQAQAERAARVAALVAFGLDPVVAARIDDDGNPPGPVSITLDTEDIHQTLRANLTETRENR